MVRYQDMKNFKNNCVVSGISLRPAIGMKFMCVRIRWKNSKD